MSIDDHVKTCYDEMHRWLGRVPARQVVDWVDRSIKRSVTRHDCVVAMERFIPSLWGSDWWTFGPAYHQRVYETVESYIFARYGE